MNYEKAQLAEIDRKRSLLKAARNDMDAETYKALWENLKQERLACCRVIHDLKEHNKTLRIARHAILRQRQEEQEKSDERAYRKWLS